MLSIQVNNYNYVVKSNLSIIEACKFIGIVLPRFCYHEKLSVAASCRMCVVEVEKLPKPLTACSADLMSNISIFTDTPFLQKARENILEALLLNHPLDCPICDQAGECDLQDQVKVFGSFYSRLYLDNKITVEDKYCGPLIRTIMTRCIMCTRCVRFGSEIAGVDFLGSLNRGVSSEIGGYISKLLNSEISGNVIDLCPVGALTANTYSFKARPWELRTLDSIDVLDGLGSNVYLNFKESEIMRVLPKTNEDLNENWISDKTRFSYDALSSNSRLQTVQSNFSSDKTDFKFNFTKTNFKNTTFLINEDIDLELLFLMKNLSRLDKSIKICSVDNFNIKDNFHVSWNFDKVKNFASDIRNCFIFTSNVRVENALINTKLRVKFLHKNFDVVGFGLSTNSNFPITCLNLDLKSILLLLEGRYSSFSSKFFNKNPLILFGASFNKRFGASTSSISSFIKKKFPTSIICDIYGNANTSSIHYLGMKPINKNIFLKSSSYVLYNLNYNHKVSNLLNVTSLINSKKFLVVFSAFKSFFDVISNNLNKDVSIVAIPSLNPIESEGIYLNLEERPQQTQTLKNMSNSVILKNLVEEFLLIKKGFIEQNFILSSIKKQEFLSSIPVKDIKTIARLSFIFEILRNYNLFDAIKKDFSFSLFHKLKTFQSYSNCSKYPFKSSVDDFFVTNIFLKHSSTMLECSRESRKLSDNF
jgi:NADH-quinone oxidoreductase chain G